MQKLHFYFTPLQVLLVRVYFFLHCAPINNFFVGGAQWLQFQEAQRRGSVISVGRDRGSPQRQGLRPWSCSREGELRAEGCSCHWVALRGERLGQVKCPFPSLPGRSPCRRSPGCCSFRTECGRSQLLEFTAVKSLFSRGDRAEWGFSVLHLADICDAVLI